MNLTDIKETKRRGWKDQDFAPAKSNSSRRLVEVDQLSEKKRVDETERRILKLQSTCLEDYDLD